MIKKINLFLIIVLVALSCNNPKIALNPPVHLTCESDTNSIGIDISNPAMGWQLNDTGIGIVQGAYQILVASKESLLDEQNADMWNPGKVISANSQFIIYEGKQLAPFHKYYWKVQTWDTSGVASGYSNSSWFETGLMGTKLNASWIKPTDNFKNRSSVIYRKEFEIPKKINKATVYASGVGAYVIYVNGKRLGDEHLSPGWTIFDKRVQYQIYDATGYIADGENAIGSIVGKFWDDLENSKIASSLQFILQMKIEYTDGSIEWINTDKSWKIFSSPVELCAYGSGERYNANLEIENWCNPKFDDKNWLSVQESKRGIKLVHAQLPPIKVLGNAIGKKVTKSGTNTYMIDFGEELCGWIHIKEKLGKRTEIKIKYISENKGSKKDSNEISVDEYISDGKSSDWEPEFSYHKFRFAEISGLSSKPSENSVIARIAYPNLHKTGQFSCSNELVNKIKSGIDRTGRNSLITMLTGLPESDSRKSSPVNAQSFAGYALYNYNMGNAFEKYIIDLRDLQGSNGKMNFLQNKSEGTNSPGWPEVILSIPWKAYLFTGDKRVLLNNYDAMKAWHSSQQRESDAEAPPYMHNKEGQGDLFSLDSTPTKPIGSAYYYYASTLMSEIAEAIGNSEDATEYMELAGFTKDQYNQTYLTYRTSRYWANTQTAHIIPLAVGLTPLSYVQKVTKFITSDISKNDIHSTTGVLSTQFLLPLLSENGEHELAYKLITQTTQPSLGFAVVQGLSEAPGCWGKNTNYSYQLAFASEGEWLYSYLAGIRPDAKNPGFKHSIIDPNPAGDLKWAEASINTLYGLLKSRWEISYMGIISSVTIPPNTSSTIMLPVVNSKKAEIIYNNVAIVHAGKITNQCPSFIKFKGFNANMAVFDIGSGNYKFIVK